MRLTIKKINKAIENTGLELVKIKDYFNFIPRDDADQKFSNAVYTLDSTSVWAYVLSRLTLEQWVAKAEEFAQMAKDAMEEM